MIIKRECELEIMAKAAVINREALEAVEKAIKPQVTTKELNDIAEQAIYARGGRPAFKGYRRGKHVFPATLCTSKNEVVVHGIPDKIPLQKGNILSIDIGTFYKGYAADMAKTYAIGPISRRAKSLIEITKHSLYLGIAEAQVGKRLGDISAAIQSYVEKHNMWVVREFVGHGVGAQFHEQPELPNFGTANRGPKLRPGLVLAIEPMVTEARAKVTVLEDGWTAPTTNGSLAAHFEHTVAITEAGPRILTDKDQSPRDALALKKLLLELQKEVYGKKAKWQTQTTPIAHC